MENRKIKNATPVSHCGLKFKSKLEAVIYNTLLDYGFKVQYEPLKYIIWEGFNPSVPFYSGSKKNLKIDNTKLRNITYTPDFLINYNGICIIIEAKGRENDVYPIKRKLFRKWLEYNTKGENFLFFEVYSKKQLIQAINIIYETARKNNSGNPVPS